MAKKSEEPVVEPTPEEKKPDPAPIPAVSQVPMGLWVTPNQEIDVEVYAYRDAEGNVKLLSPNSLLSSIVTQLNLVEFPIKAKFSMPDKNQVDLYKRRSTKFSPEAEMSIVDIIKLRTFYIQRHLLTLDLQTPDGKSLELKRDEQGDLLPASRQVLSLLHPTIQEHLAMKFIQNAIL